MESNMKLEQLRLRLLKIEAELSKCRTSTMQDGWQTQKYAKKARKWDALAQRKIELIEQINDIETISEISQLIIKEK